MSPLSSLLWPTTVTFTVIFLFGLFVYFAWATSNASKKYWFPFAKLYKYP